MAGPFARLIAQVVVMSANVMMRAFVQAYQQASANPNAAKQAAQNAKRTLRKEMPLDEALKVLNLETMPKESELVAERFKRYFDANDPKNGGSFYLQSKFYRAKEVVEAQMAEDAATAAGSNKSEEN